MKYKASLDYLAKIVTIGVTVLFAVIIAGQISILKDDHSMGTVLTISALTIIYFATYAYRPVSYILTDNKMVIRRPLFDKTIVRTDIKSVEKLDDGALKWSVRTFGAGGLFGYFGRFYKGNIGVMTWYATRRDKAVLIRTTNNKKIIVTPDDYEKFVTELQR
jgi:Bacterial PH domain